jgi:hypothetical protein
MNGFLGLNRLKTRAALVEENGLSGEMAEAVFKRVEPVQHDENGTAFYLEGMVDRAIEEVWLERKRLSSPPNAFVSEKETPNMFALDGTSSTERLLNALCEILARRMQNMQEPPPPVVAAPPLKEWYTPEEAAVDLNRKPSQIRELCRKRVFGSKDGCGKWQINKSEIERFRLGRITIHGEVF